MPKDSTMTDTQWLTPSSQPASKQVYQSGDKYLELSDKATQFQTEALTPVSFIESGFLAFRTESIFCSITEVEFPDLAELKDISFFSIDYHEEMIGELKIDPSTLTSTLGSAPADSTPTIEIISLFELDFKSSALQGLLVMNSFINSARFGAEFTDMVENREDKTVRVVMWIR